MINVKDQRGRTATIFRPGDSIRDLFGMVIRDPFKGLSDLQLGDQKVTLNHLGMIDLLITG